MIFKSIGSVVTTPVGRLYIRLINRIGSSQQFSINWTNDLNNNNNRLTHTTNVVENVEYDVRVSRLDNHWHLRVDTVQVVTNSAHTDKGIAINDTLLDDTGYMIGDGFSGGGNSELRASIRDFTISNNFNEANNWQWDTILDLNTKKEYIWSTFGVQQRTNAFQIIEGFTSGAKIDAANAVNVSTYVVGTKEQLPFLKPVFGGLGPAFLVARDTNSDKSNYDSWNKTQFIVGEVVKIDLWSTVNGMYTINAITDITYNGDPFHAIQLECVPVTTTTTTTTTTPGPTTTTTTTTPPEHELDVVFVRWS